VSSPASSPVNVIIAGSRFSYPHGMGASARVHAYAKGLLESGARVRVVSLLSPPLSGGPGDHDLASGVHEGVPYVYACGTRVRGRSFLRRRLIELRVPVGLWRASRRLFAGQDGPKAIIAYTQEPTWIVFMAVLARLHGASAIVELCEMPLVYESSPARRVALGWLQDAVAYRVVDGFIAISTCLEDYVRRHAPSATPTIRVPILVATQDFADGEATDAPRRPREIVYVGDMRWHEEELTDLLSAFSIVARGEPDVILRLVGQATHADMAGLTARVAELGLVDRVVFAGSVQRSQLPALLRAATVLALLRRDALFSRAGLPTKLAEYLASGRPVVVTAIGDIPRYLSNGCDAYLARPGDPAGFADVLRHVLENESEASAVGARGRSVALRQFDRRRHGARLAAFVSALDERKVASPVARRSGGEDHV